MIFLYRPLYAFIYCRQIKLSISPTPLHLTCYLINLTLSNPVTFNFHLVVADWQSTVNVPAAQNYKTTILLEPHKKDLYIAVVILAQ